MINSSSFCTGPRLPCRAPRNRAPGAEHLGCLVGAWGRLLSPAAVRVWGQLITIPVLNPGWKAALPAHGTGMEWHSRMDAVGRGCSSGWFRRSWSSSENLTGHGWALTSSQRLFQVAPGTHPPACLAQMCVACGQGRAAGGSQEGWYSCSSAPQLWSPPFLDGGLGCQTRTKDDPPSSPPAQLHPTLPSAW